jgi:hypothetical protein
MRSQFYSFGASAIMALALAVPAAAQGKGAAKKPPKASTPPASRSAVSGPTTTGAPATSGTATPTAGTSATTTSPFSWMDDASLVEPGTAWVGLSTVRWHGGGVSQTIVPVFDGTFGITPRTQVSASVPRTAGGLGAMFFSAKLNLLTDAAHNVMVSVAPTLGVLPGDPTAATGRQAQVGLPVSAHVDRPGGRLFTSAGYFSPGIWYAGAGAGRSMGERAGISASVSRSWTTSTSTDSGATAVPGTSQVELSGGLSYAVTPTLSAFCSLGRTYAAGGASTTIGIGLSLGGRSTLPVR